MSLTALVKQTKSLYISIFKTTFMRCKWYGLNLSKIKKAVSLSEERYCGVIDMFRKFAELKFTIHINE